jgi:hypothetical protein
VPAVDPPSDGWLAMRPRVTATIALLWATSCVDSSGVSRPRPLSELGVAEAWLGCIDCRGSFLQRLAATPDRRRDSVVRFLASALLNGPDSGRRARHKRGLRRIWNADSAYAASLGQTLHASRDEFLHRYGRGYEIMWRSRAAIALGVIRTHGALSALDSASVMSFGTGAEGDSTIMREILRARSDTGRSILDSFP